MADMIYIVAFCGVTQCNLVIGASVSEECGNTITLTSFL